VENQSNKSVWLRELAKNFIISKAREHYPLETGGVLMGYFAELSNIPVILYASGPGPKAIHFRNYYRPDSDYDNLEIARVYEESQRKITYLGDWHTHLKPYGGLSYRDKRTLRRIALCKSARVETPIMLVLSYGGQWEATVWQGHLKKSRLWYRQLLISQLKMNLFSKKRVENNECS